MMGGLVLTLASVPSGHPYVDSVVDPSRIHLLPDPVPRDASTPGQWWPPRFLESDYLFRHLGSFDVLHVHFGFEEFTAEELRGVVDILRRARIPLVLTVHDLHNPHFADPTLHLSQLDVLVPAATEVITLTRGAASVIRRRWGRDAVVLPHPHVLPLERVGVARALRRVPVIGIHGKGLRASVQPWPILDALLDGDLPACVVRFDLDENGAPAGGGSMARLAKYRRAGVDVRVHPRFTDDELAAYLLEVDVVVLPYRFGTHSGWAEACHDAGTTVVSPRCGFFVEQHPGPVFDYGPTGLDGAELRRAVSLGVQTSRTVGEDREKRSGRARERQWVRDRMVDLYVGAMATAVAA
ncbi:hypothetical protein EAH80_29030 [Mycobacterium hodleri]|uniref:Glycosyltransferase subfamily 4-like N-terminal domain-containing protein n=2 Tax=Mycolicibacterium hodleri TaxID=49897 RepID=A0A502DQL3_9MYCO|nr:hypothetical protein EAH80_29030 [Mycolicibacterium hodleri]